LTEVLKRRPQFSVFSFLLFLARFEENLDAMFFAATFSQPYPLFLRAFPQFVFAQRRSSWSARFIPSYLAHFRLSLEFFPESFTRPHLASVVKTGPFFPHLTFPAKNWDDERFYGSLFI